MPKPKDFKPTYAGDLNANKGHSAAERAEQIKRVKAQREDILKQMPK